MQPARIGHEHFVHRSLPSEYVILYGKELCILKRDEKKSALKVLN